MPSKNYQKLSKNVGLESLLRLTMVDFSMLPLALPKYLFHSLQLHNVALVSRLSFSAMSQKCFIETVEKG